MNVDFQYFFFFFFKLQVISDLSLGQNKARQGAGVLHIFLHGN